MQSKDSGLRNMYVVLVSRSCAGLFVLLEMVIATLQTDEDLSALFGELGEASWCCRAGKEARRPFNVPGFPIGRFLALTLLQLLFLVCGFGVLLAEDGFGNTVPELARLVGQLLLGRRNNLLYGPQRIDVD